MVIVCGWCGHPTEWETTALEPTGWECRSCGHESPANPWIQRGKQPPEVRTDATGRPTLDPKAIRQRLREARADLGEQATQAQLADHLGISSRTLGRWQKMSD